MSYNSEVLADTPVGYWKLSETSGGTAADSSGNGHSGTYINCALGQSGMISGETETAVLFNGASSYVDLGNPSALQFSGQIGIELIFKSLFPTVGTGMQLFLIGKGFDGSAQGYVRFYIGDATTTSKNLAIGGYNGSTHETSASFSWPTGEVHHLFTQYTGSKWQLYVDGALAGETPDSTGWLGSTKNFTIGVELQGSPVNYFHGTIEKVAIYNTFLNGTRISAHAVAGGFASAIVTLTAASVPATGDRVDLTFSGAVAGILSSDFQVTADGIPLRLLAATGSASAWSLPLDSAFITAGQAVKASYLGSVVAHVNLTATNSSTVPLPVGRYMKKNFGAFITFSGLTYPALDTFPGQQAAFNTAFHPTSYSMDNILDGVQAMGCAYTVFTAKHGDAVCLWPTASGAPNIGPTPWYAKTRIDIVRDYVTKARARGLGVGIYLNFYDPYFTAARPGANGTYTNTGPTFLAYINQQITELLSNYGPIDYLWLDAWGYMVGYAIAPYATVRSLISSLQPNCIVLNNDHTGDLSHSDVAIFEGVGVQPEPPSSNILPAEFCETSNSKDASWVWHIGTENMYLDPFAVAATLKRLNAKHSNYLLNITPNDLGVLPTAQAAFCVALGGIIGTQGPIPPLPRI